MVLPLRPLIGLTMEKWPDSATLSLAADYARSVRDAGGVPVFLPTDPTGQTVPTLLAPLHGLILTGGGDIDPETFQHRRGPILKELDPERDAFERWLLTAWWPTDRPVLGICRGLQMMNLQAGGSLIQDIPSECPDALEHGRSPSHPPPFHAVQVENGSTLATMLGVTGLTVNSIHHQAIDRLGAGYRVVARAPDGMIEAIEATDRAYAVAVQWHPEELTRNEETQAELFRSFVRFCASVL